MPEATNTPTTPARKARRRQATAKPLGRRQAPAAHAPTLLADRYIPAATAAPVQFNWTDRTIAGHLLGTMHARGQVHHHRIKGSDGVVYFVPPAWLDAASQAAVAAPTINPGTSKSEIIRSLIREIAALLDARDARNGVTA